MLIRTVSRYLESHKRLVVPQLGTFIVKQPGSVLFTELLKRDDGVLRNLLCAEGRTPLEAAGEIDRFVFEVRHAVQRGEEFPLAGFGVIRPGPNATVAFVYDPRTDAPAAPERKPRKERPAAEPAAQSAEQSAQSAQSADGAAAEQPRQPAAPHVDAERVAEAMRGAFAEPHISRSAKMNPDPSVRGLRYGKPTRTTDAYRYVERPPRRRFDLIIWIAVAVILLAIGAIAYGYWSDLRAERADGEFLELTQPEQPQAASDAAAGQTPDA